MHYARCAYCRKPGTNSTCSCRIDPTFLAGDDREFYWKWRRGEAVMLPDDLERLRAEANKEQARRAEVEEVCKLAKEVMIADMNGGSSAVTKPNIYAGYIFSIAEAFVAERKKREDWK